MNLLGTFAPYMTVHKDSVVKIDPDIPFESAAIDGLRGADRVRLGDQRRRGAAEALILTAKTGTCVVTGMGAMADVDVKLNLFLFTICRRR